MTALPEPIAREFWTYNGVMELFAIDHNVTIWFRMYYGWEAGCGPIQKLGDPRIYRIDGDMEAVHLAAAVCNEEIAADVLADWIEDHPECGDGRGDLDATEAAALVRLIGGDRAEV